MVGCRLLFLRDIGYQLEPVWKVRGQQQGGIGWDVDGSSGGMDSKAEERYHVKHYSTQQAG